MASKFFEPDQTEKFRQSEIDLRVKHTKVGVVLAMILVPAGASLDYFVYPERFFDFFLIRIVCDLVLIPVYVSLFCSFGRRYINSLSTLWALTPAVAISVMIYIAEGSVSPYYAGLNLMIIVSCQLLPYGLGEAVLYCFMVLISYSLACWSHTEAAFSASDFYNNIYFIILTSIISVTSTYYYRIRRIADFRLRYDLDKSNQELTQLDQMKSQFFANVSHELRTPLTLILGPIQDLLSASRQLPESVASMLHMAQTNALRLLKLVNDLLDVLRLEEGKAQFFEKTFELNAFLSGIIKSVSNLAETRGIALEKESHESLIYVHADPNALERILLNLLGNALKFTPRGGKITVRNVCRDKGVHLQVIDTGIGIAESDLPYIFDRFHQADGSSTRPYQGTGLGLALVKELVENMKGAIDATSVLGKGTTMTVRLPVVEAPSDRRDIFVEEIPKPYGKQDHDGAPVEFSIAHDARPELAVLPMDEPDVLVESNYLPTHVGKLLIVDDEPDMRRYLAKSLSDEYTIFQAKGGRSALELARKQQPDLILLDLMLPELDGLEVCRRLKASEDTRGIKIILLTARVDEEAKLTALKHGADDFLTKPFSRLEVKTRLKNLLNAAVLEKELQRRNISLQAALTELKQTQAHLINNEKLSALGRLSAGLLHEINNPLNYAMAALEMARMDLHPEADGEIRETLDDASDGMKRINDIVVDLRAFAYPSEFDKTVDFDFKETLTSALRFTAHDLKGIAIEQKLDPYTWVRGSRSHIIQVLINLFTNSAKAIEHISQQRQGRITISSVVKKQRLFVSVKDNGYGMDAETKARVFDPFFTTRKVGEGMGLGLSICHTIITNHGGQLAVDSDEGYRTEFQLDLALAESMAGIEMASS